MKRKTKDRHLDIPAEANRDKHINFLALESGETDPSDHPPTGKLAGNDKKNNKKKLKEGRKNKGK